MNKNTVISLMLALCPLSAHAAAINLGTADSFAVLAGSTATNTGPTTIHGNLGVWPGTAITGFPPGIVSAGVIHNSDASAMQAQSDLITAFNVAAGAACGTVLTGQDLGGLTLTPGVYCFATSAQLTGTLTLNALGDPLAAFIFQIGSTLTTASSSSVVFTNGGQGGAVFWQVGSSATLGTTTSFTGNILALTSITLNNNATIDCGRALARNGAVTMDTNTVAIDTTGCRSTADNATIPEPATAATLLTALIAGLLLQQRQMRNGHRLALSVLRPDRIPASF